MKIQKNVLKALIKECLVEILSEGLGNNLVETISRSTPITHQKLLPRPQSAYLDRKVGPDPSLNKRLMEAVKEQSVGGPSYMRDILADTAKNTLASHMGSDGERSVAKDAAGMMMEQMTPEQLVGEETVSKWAALAFDKRKFSVPMNFNDEDMQNIAKKTA